MMTGTPSNIAGPIAVFGLATALDRAIAVGQRLDSLHIQLSSLMVALCGSYRVGSQPEPENPVPRGLMGTLRDVFVETDQKLTEIENTVAELQALLGTPTSPSGTGGRPLPGALLDGTYSVPGQDYPPAPRNA